MSAGAEMSPDLPVAYALAEKAGGAPCGRAAWRVGCARLVVEAGWRQGRVDEPMAAQAVDALESAGLLADPETAAELGRLREQVARVADAGEGEPVLPWAALLDDVQVDELLADVADAATAGAWTDSRTVLAELEKTLAHWRKTAGEQAPCPGESGAER